MFHFIEQITNFLLQTVKRSKVWKSRMHAELEDLMFVKHFQEIYLICHLITVNRPRLLLPY